MNRARIKNVSLTLLCLILLLNTLGLGQVGEQASKAFKEVGIDQKLNEQIPLDIHFKDELGRDIQLKDYVKSKPVIVSLVYYRCPMLCTQVLNGMVETFRTLELTAGEEFDVITVSIDPVETPDLAAEKKKHYVEEYGRSGVENGWHFLTGDQESIAKLADAVGFRFVYDNEAKQFAHASGIMVLTPEGKLARYLYGIEYSAKDLRFSLMEAAQNKIGSSVDKLLLLCYHYDPMTGKYGVVVGNILRGGGILTVLLLGGYMLVNFRRDRLKTIEPAKNLGS